MTLKSFLVGLFRGHSADGELEQVREAARADAQLMVGTYVVEFEAEAARIFTSRQQRFLGLDNEEEVEVVEVTAKKAMPCRRRKLVGRR